MNTSFNCVVIFGGCGFIGSHFANHLLSTGQCDRVILADIAERRTDFDSTRAAIEYVCVDVRTSPTTWNLPTHVDLIANFAAVHREPGHELHEYYETNLPGADNVCAFAELVDCKQIVFTSSIAPYGPTESVKTESSIPTPNSGYGGSKLAAEKIHMGWQRAGSDRKLVVVRPGVVFGPGERGNVTRLVQATMRRYFFYMGNRKTCKAGGYVKELTNSILWVLDRLPKSGGSILYNFCMKNPPTVEDYVEMVCKVSGVKRHVMSVPYLFLLTVAYAIDLILRPLRINHPFSPVRIRKLVRSNNIVPSYLLAENYPFRYTLESSFRDWREDRPSEWR
jgi:nucleoside-diphosphate-sugar epimerase